MTVNPARVARGSIERLKQKRYNFIGVTLFKYLITKYDCFYSLALRI